MVYVIKRVVPRSEENIAYLMKDKENVVLIFALIGFGVSGLGVFVAFNIFLPLAIFLWGFALACEGILGIYILYELKELSSVNETVEVDEDVFDKLSKKEARK